MIAAHQHGRKNVVASMGTALTERQVYLVRSLAKTFVLALDADTAGQEATRSEASKRIVAVPLERRRFGQREEVDPSYCSDCPKDAIPMISSVNRLIQWDEHCPVRTVPYNGFSH